MNNGTLRTAYSTQNNREHKWPNAKQIFKQAIPYGVAGGLEFETHFTASVWDLSMKENNKTVTQMKTMKTKQFKQLSKERK